MFIALPYRAIPYPGFRWLATEEDAKAMARCRTVVNAILVAGMSSWNVV